MALDCSICVRASTEYRSWLRKRASALGITVSDLVFQALDRHAGSAKDSDVDVSNQLQILRDQVERLHEQLSVMGELLVAHSEYYFTHHPPLKTDHDKAAAQKSVQKQSEFLHQRVLQHVEDASGFVVFEQAVRQKLNPDNDEMVDVFDPDILIGGDY